jgi:DNA-binding IclR family transcriptional regulator
MRARETLVESGEKGILTMFPKFARPASPAKTPRAPAVDRALDILELLASSRAGLTLSDLSNSLGVPKSSVHYLLHTLQRRGYLHRNEVTNRLLLGLKIVTLSNAALSCIELRRHAAPHLRQLAERAGLTVHLAVLQGDEAVLVDKLEPAGVARLATWVGKRMDLHCTGVGKAILAYLPEEQFDRLARDRHFVRYNENTITSRHRILEEIGRTRKRGYALEDEEGEIGFRCVGCPIFDLEGCITAAVSVAGTTSQITTENVALLAEYVQKAAEAISRSSGSPAAVPGSSPMSSS